MGRCIVICAGDLTVGRLERKKEDYVIAVDGGLSYCELLKLEPDLIVGDFDSMNEEQREAVLELKDRLPDRVAVLNREKDDTDTLAALRIGLDKGYRNFLLYGATGGRLEHTLANIQCLLFLKKQGATGYLMDGDGMILVLKDEEVVFRENMEGYLSLFSLGGEARGVTIRGMKYELQDAVLTNDFPIGISNEFTGKEAVISVRDGEIVGIVKFFS